MENRTGPIEAGYLTMEIINSIYQEKWNEIDTWLKYRRCGKFPEGMSADDFYCKCKDQKVFAEFLNVLLDLSQCVIAQFPELRETYSDSLCFWESCKTEWLHWDLSCQDGQIDLAKSFRDNLLRPLKKKENPFPETPLTTHNHQFFDRLIALRKMPANQRKVKRFKIYWDQMISCAEDLVDEQLEKQSLS